MSTHERLQRDCAKPEMNCLDEMRWDGSTSRARGQHAVFGPILQWVPGYTATRLVCDVIPFCWINFNVFWLYDEEVHVVVLCCVYVPPPHHNRFTALFPGPPGWASARRELLDFMVQGKTSRGRDYPAGRHSVRTNQCPPPPSPFFKGWMRFLSPN